MSYYEVSLENITRDVSSNTRKTKIFCTLGPACWSVDGLVKLIDSGMNVARFNFSHGDHESHFATLERLRTAIEARPGCNVAVLLDTKGPEIRTGFLDPSCGGKLKLYKGSTIEVGTDYQRPCTPEYLACSYPSLPKSVGVGSSILVADGSLMLRVIEVKESSVMAEVLNNVAIGDRKNMNLPGAVVDLPTLTEKDVKDLQDFAVVHKVDFIAASFVRKGSDLDTIRSVLGEKGSTIKIISKIENQEGLENYDEILSKSDGIMVARGDLGMEIPLEKVFIAQKMMISRAHLAGKPVVTATQMLESMITNPRPTRAECADVATAVLDGTDCVMLSGETANGDFSVEAVTMMSNTCLQAESIIDYYELYNLIRARVKKSCDCMSPVESVASSAVKTARDVSAKLLLVLTETSFSAGLIAKYRPGMRILALTKTATFARQMNGYMKGVEAQIVPSLHHSGEIIVKTIEAEVAAGRLTKGDNVVCIHGSTEEVAGSTNMMRVYTA